MILSSPRTRTPFHDSAVNAFTKNRFETPKDAGSPSKRRLEDSPKRNGVGEVKRTEETRERPERAERTRASREFFRPEPQSRFSRPEFKNLSRPQLAPPMLSARSKSLIDFAQSPPRPAKLRRAALLLAAAADAAPDRFIPSHRNSSRGKLASAAAQPHPNALPQTHIKAQTSKIYQHHVAAACGLDVTLRILSFCPPPPERATPLSLFSAVDAARARSPSLRPAAASARAKKIPSAPDRVLDAPNIVDDFYLNLVAWSHTNLIVVGLDDAVYVWNASTGAVGLLCELAGTTVSSLRWLDDGSYILVGRDDGAVEIWDIETNARLRTLGGGAARGRVAAQAWLLHMLTLGAKDGSICHSDVRVAQHLVHHRAAAHAAEVCGLEYRADGHVFASGGNDNVVAIWDARAGGVSADALYRKNAHRAAVKALAWCPTQRLLLALGGGSSDRTIHFWNAALGARVNLIETGAQISSLHWGHAHATGLEVVATHGFPLNAVSLFSYPTLQKTGEIAAAHDLRILGGCLSPDGTTLATVAGDENLKFWGLFDARPHDRPDAKAMAKLMNIR